MMMATAPSTPVFAVGDPTRKRIGRATVTALWTAVAFVTYLWTAKQVRPLYVHEPWQNDPYDAVVSFAFFFVPVLAALCLTRAVLCKSSRPLPVRRARELLIAGRLMLAVAGVTLAAEWVSFAVGADRDLWDSTTNAMLAALGLMTVLVLVAGVLVLDALRRTPAAGTGPDWWSDAATVIDEYWPPGLPLGAPFARFAKRVIDQAGAAVRGRPLVTAAIVSAAFGALLATVQALAEEGFAPPVFVLYMSVAAASMFAFLVAAGAHLNLAGRRQPLGGRSRRFADSAATSAAGFVAALAFRDVLQPVTQLVPGQGVAHLLAGCLFVALVGGVAVFAVESALGVHRSSRLTDS